MTTHPPGVEERFRALYADHFDAVLGFALRRCDRAEDAADVTSETFLVAWCRLSEVPGEPATRPWLYGVARRVLANQRRGAGRRAALGARLRADLPHAVADIADDVVHDLDVTLALSTLAERDREVLELHLWEGLAAREIAEVLDVSAAVVRPRLSRARTRLRNVLGRDPDAGNVSRRAGHLPSNTPRLVPEEER